MCDKTMAFLLRHEGGGYSWNLIAMNSVSSEVSESDFGVFTEGSAGKFAFERFWKPENNSGGVRICDEY